MLRNLRHEVEDLKQGPISREESCSELLDFATRTVTKMRGKELFIVQPTYDKEEKTDSASSEESENDEDDDDDENDINDHRAVYKAAVQFEKELETLLESIKDCKKRFHKKLRRLSKE